MHPEPKSSKKDPLANDYSLVFEKKKLMFLEGFGMSCDVNGNTGKNGTV